MGIFFRTTPAAATTRTEPVRPGAPAPVTAGGVHYEQMVQETDTGSDVSTPGQQKFLWGRLVFAVVLLVVIFMAGVYCDTHGPELKPWGDMLMHSFTLLFGAFLGLLAGEAARR